MFGTVAKKKSIKILKIAKETTNHLQGGCSFRTEFTVEDKNRFSCFVATYGRFRFSQARA